MRSCFLLLTAVVATATYAEDAVGRFRSHLGLQLYSLRDHYKEGVGLTLDRIKNWQVTEVETAGTANLPVREFVALLHERGLKPVSAHIGYERLSNDLAGAITEARALGVAYALCPVVPHGQGFDDAAAKTVGAKFNEWGKAFKAAGIQFGYHLHGGEFAPSTERPGERVFDVLVHATDPALVVYEMDVFWVLDAGIDPVTLLNKYPDRWVMLHVKDLRKGGLKNRGVSKVSPTDRVPVGEGEVDWPVVLRAATKVGVKYFFIEDEGPSPLQDIPKSLDYLRKLKF
jgi:sugar phosphate isomerase/epimerase